MTTEEFIHRLHEALDASDWTDLVQAHRAILYLHPPTNGAQGDRPDGTYGIVEPACTSCGDGDEHGIAWPCATVRAIAQALDVPIEVPRG
jgi:hypothetical protein